MKRTVIWASWLYCLVLTTSVNAQYQLVGPGSASCGEYVDARRQNSDLANYFVVWVQGYLSGLNIPALATDKPAAIIPPSSTLALMLEKACIQHPSGLVMEAAASVMQSLEKKKYNK